MKVTYSEAYQAACDWVRRCKDDGRPLFAGDIANEYGYGTDPCPEKIMNILYEPQIPNKMRVRRNHLEMIVLLTDFMLQEGI